MLCGGKVVLRPVRRGDLEALYAWKIDPELWQLGSDKPVVPLGFEAYVRALADQGDDSDAEFAIEVDCGLIGRCGLFDIDLLARTGKVGITIGDRDAWGHGYGSDSLRTLVDYAFTMRNLQRVWLDTLAGNQRGLLAYRAAGFTEEGRLRRHAWVGSGYGDVVIMGILRDGPV
ncbi:MAG: GNAT family N-acetyltransferase [Actinomycetota bacterium]|jgi:RimJ/RimL family protein N-acetyltransferase|nr:GNAT family N-acetyltransferase [Euzebyaceae bacterium]MDQ3453327.1 GNAT family N-acetyltransferase [Actinomycetota bacterium]